jgi:hypothetical protein
MEVWGTGISLLNMVLFLAYFVSCQRWLDFLFPNKSSCTVARVLSHGNHEKGFDSVCENSRKIKTKQTLVQTITFI